MIAGLLAVASVAGAVGVAAAAQGDANDSRAVGPISTQNGYPIWFSDADGTEVELCLDQNPLCRYLPTDVADPNRPISFPDNYPGESFWWAAESSIADGLTKKVVLVMALEAAFASGEVAKPGDQVSFGRIRVRMDDTIPGATYKVTHPYGVETLEADEDGRVFWTEDIGALTLPADHSMTLKSRIFDNLLQWDTERPEGYLGDPNVEHTVEGSPKATNYFRVEGPAGSFGPNQACPLPDGGFVTDGSCVESNLFSVMGKRPTISGVETLRAIRVDENNENTDYLEVFVKSLDGQKIMLSGAGIATTEMVGTSTGRGDLYYAKVLLPGAAPAEITATNETDGTSWTAPVTDLIDVTSAKYDLGTKTLTVAAHSSVATGVTLTALPGGDLLDGTVSTMLPSPPLNVVVKSTAGGSTTEPVRLVGADLQSAAVTAASSANPTTAIPNQVVTLDSAGSSGDIATYKWNQTGGTPVLELRGRNKAVANFDAPAVTEDLTFRLTVTGNNGSIATSDVTVHVVANQQPISNAGPDQAAIVGTIVTLDGTASQFAKNYDWFQADGPAVTLTGANTPIATFLMPDTNKPLVFRLRAKAGPELISNDTVTITKVPDVLTITRAELRTGDGQLRVDGTSTLFSMPNVVTFYASDGVNKSHTGKVLGTITVDPVTLGTFAFRAEGITLPAGVNRIDIFTDRGGVLENVPLTIRT